MKHKNIISSKRKKNNLIKAMEKLNKYKLIVIMKI